MDAQDIILQIKQDNSNAVVKMAELKKTIDSLKNNNKELNNTQKELVKEMNELAKAGKGTSNEFKELEKSYNNNTQLIVENNQATAELSRQMKDQSMQVSILVKS